jgi:hypothetical protein
MKKYFLGLTAVVCALAFSAFTKPFTTLTFKLKVNPVAVGRVANDANWTTAGTGQYFGDCTGAAQELACRIMLNDIRSTYFHTEGGEVILNTQTYANTNHVDYLEIPETTGLLSGGVQDYIIDNASGIIAKQYVSNNNFQTVSLGADLSYANAEEVD